MTTPQTLPGAVKHQVIAGFTQPPPATTKAVPSSSQTWAAARWTWPGSMPARACGLGTVTVARGDAEDPPFPAGTFDVILAGNVIQFHPRPAYAVRGWLCLLKPGGTFGFSWGLAQDPGWEPVMAAVDAHMPAGMPGFEAFLRRPPFGCTGPVEQMLIGTGYQAVQAITHQVETVYGSPEEWWAACQSQGPWAISWRHIPPARLEAARQDAFTILDDLRARGGTLTRTLTFACTTARRGAT